MSEKRLTKSPRLRVAEKVPPPYPLGKFPGNFAIEVGRHVLYVMATKSKPTIEGSEWEAIFANSIGASWKPSNVGLDDVLLYNCAWGAKTVYATKPWNTKKVRLISGRNSPIFSYGDTVGPKSNPDMIGEKVLEIWNHRVESIRATHRHVRTVVLIKSRDLLNLTIFEFETIRYDPELYKWKWNKRGNLEGYRVNEHVFTWQPHGSQFTIIEKVPESKLCIELKKPRKVDPELLLKTLGVDDSWIRVVSNN